MLPGASTLYIGDERPFHVADELDLAYSVGRCRPNLGTWRAGKNLDEVRNVDSVRCANWERQKLPTRSQRMPAKDVPKKNQSG